MTRKWLGPLLIVIAAAASLAVFDRLPERVPTHWNFRGEIDDYGPRFPYAFFGPLVATALWILLPVLRKVDPRKRNYERFDDTWWLLLNLVTLSLLVLHGLTLSAALGGPIDVVKGMLFTIGLMFVLLGNYLPRIRSNWWLGIRTPWTLESDEVWRRTHRLGGRTFVIGGLLCMASAFLPSRVAPWTSMAALAIAALTPVIYSFVVYRRLGADGNGSAALP